MKTVDVNESFLQLMKFAALDRWGHLADTHQFEMVTDDPHEWVYRGQIIQKNRRVEVDAVITRVEESPCPALWAEGYLRAIYLSDEEFRFAAASGVSLKKG